MLLWQPCSKKYTLKCTLDVTNNNKIFLFFNQTGYEYTIFNILFWCLFSQTINMEFVYWSVHCPTVWGGGGALNLSHQRSSGVNAVSQYEESIMYTIYILNINYSPHSCHIGFRWFRYCGFQHISAMFN